LPIMEKQPCFYYSAKLAPVGFKSKGSGEYNFVPAEYTSVSLISRLRSAADVAHKPFVRLFGFAIIVPRRDIPSLVLGYCI
jgi:hypothetical protein